MLAQQQKDVDMDVQGGSDYEELRFRHTPAETDDETAWVWQPISSSELIIHAANLHLFRTMGVTPSGAPLWSCSNRTPPYEEKKVPAR
jgi:hypothetical protein